MASLGDRNKEASYTLKSVGGSSTRTRYSTIFLVSLCASLVMLHYPSLGYSMTGNEWKKFENDPLARLYIIGTVDTWDMVQHIIMGDVIRNKFGDDQQKLNAMASLWAMDQKMLASEINDTPGLSIYSNLSKCISERRMTYGQIEAIVRRYLERFPEDWHLPLSVITLDAVTDVCKDHPKY